MEVALGVRRDAREAGRLTNHFVRAFVPPHAFSDPGSCPPANRLGAGLEEALEAPDLLKDRDLQILPSQFPGRGGTFPQRQAAGIPETPVRSPQPTQVVGVELGVLSGRQPAIV